ncbi:MAG TPA: hypothetical protein VMI75_28615 [Polyangiaceae bacterium]|nr:hypothetical protein [Polyangiaceae bacterium]
MHEDDEALQTRWETRQDRLKALLEEHGAVGLDFRADLSLGRFWWQRPDGRPVVVASTRFLLSYARSDSSILCGWANRSIPASATVPAIEGIGPRVNDCTEEDAWLLAMRIADAVGAHFLYRAPTPQSSAFLALWDVRAAAEGDAPFVPGSPWEHVRKVVEAIASQLEEGRDVSALARGYGHTFAEDHLRRGTSLEAPLRSIGERLAAIAEAPRETQRATLAALAAEVARHEAQ